MGDPIQKASILTFFFLGTPSHSLFEGTPSHSHRLTHTTLSPLPHNFPLLPEEKKKEISSQNETNLKLAQGFIYRPDRPNCRGPVPVYWSGLSGNRSVPVEFKFEFKKLSSTGSYRYTGRFDRFEFKSKFKIACVTGLERYTSRFDQFTGRFERFTKWALMGRLIFFLFFFGLTLNTRKVC